MRDTDIETIERILGKNVVGVFLNVQTEINEKSFVRLIRFLRHYQIFPANVSLCVCEDGNLRLNWTEDEKAIEVEFCPENFEYRFDGKKSDRKFTISRQVTRQLSRDKTKMELQKC